MLSKIYALCKKHGLKKFLLKLGKYILSQIKIGIVSKMYIVYRYRYITYKGVTAKIGINSKWDFDRMTGGFETYYLDSFFDKGIQKKDIYYDLGANIGINSILMGKLLPADKVNIIAFEPESSNIYSFSKNIYLNRLGNILIMPIAVTDKNGMVNFHLDNASPKSGQGGHSVKFMEKYHKAYIIVPALNLDAVIKEFNLPKPTLVSLDVEHNEESVLKGMQDILKEQTIRILVIEIDRLKDPHQSGIVRFLERYGYILDDYKTSIEGVRPHCIARFVIKRP